VAAGASEHRFFVPRALEAGVYANQFSVWHTAHEFTLDFAVAKPPESDESDDSIRTRSRVVVRVRLPITMAFEVIRKLNADMTAYEQRFGEIRRLDEGGRER
jgi:hypothetical protein